MVLGLTNEQNALLAHALMFGIEGYPIQKISGRWMWVEAFGVKGSPTVYKTKKAAVAAFEGWISAMSRNRMDYYQSA